ncbi:MAG: GNAT family N-acetyltransferase [Bacilli bacterium]|nr:GNAT family N-acetyltransferase [Bacilli bacterium]
MNEKIQIVEYEPKYAEEISEIILSNLYTINIKDYGKELIDRISVYFTKEEIAKNFPNRVKCFVAVKNGKVVGTASMDNIKSMYGVEVESQPNKYLILTVFIDMNNQHQGIGKRLIKAIEDYSMKIKAEELIIPASIHGLEFYRKCGYDYLNGNKEINKDGEYILSKKLK